MDWYFIVLNHIQHQKSPGESLVEPHAETYGVFVRKGVPAEHMILLGGRRPGIFAPSSMQNISDGKVDLQMPIYYEY